MLGYKPFYHKHFKKYITVFGTLFNDISIVREGQDGKIKTVKVPLSFMHKDKALERLVQNPDLKNSWSNIFPRMVFELQSPSYSGERKENTVNFIKKDPDSYFAKMEFSPAPYDLNFILTIFSSYYEDGLQIIEQILPFFQPEYTVSVKEIPELNLERDIHIVLNSVSHTDNIEGSFDEMRIIEWSLDFTLKGYFYGPVIEKEIIRDTKTLFKIDFEEENDNNEIKIKGNFK